MLRQMLCCKKASSRSTNNSSPASVPDSGVVDERKEKLEKRIAEEIAGGNQFVELDFGYHYTTTWTHDDRMNYSLGEETTKWIAMDQPRPCSYQKYSRDTGKYEAITLSGPSSSNDDTPEVEYRAITL